MGKKRKETEHTLSISLMNIYFAPLEGITGFTYRNAFSELFGGVEKYYAPFVSPSVNERLRGKEIRDLLPEHNNSDVNLVPQILTNNSEYFIKTVEQLMELGYTREINLNIGCPSGTVVAKKKGAGFLTDLEGMEQFFEKIFAWLSRQGKDAPQISVKTRIGMYDRSEFSEILDIYNHYPISELIIHPRTRVQMYHGDIQMEIFEYAIEHSANPLCYNGEIRTVEDYNKIADAYPIQSVMIGRGLVANPNLANEIAGGVRIKKEQIREYHDRLYHDFEKIMKADRHLLFKMKEFWNYVSWNFEKEHKCAKEIRKAQNLYKYHRAVEDIFAHMELKE